MAGAKSDPSYNPDDSSEQSDKEQPPRKQARVEVKQEKGVAGKGKQPAKHAGKGENIWRHLSRLAEPLVHRASSLAVQVERTNPVIQRQQGRRARGSRRLIHGGSQGSIP